MRTLLKKTINTVFSLLCLFFFFSCQKEEIPIIGGDTGYFFLPRTCKLINCRHAYRVLHNDVPSFIEPYYSLKPLPKEQGIETKDYIMYIMTSNYEFPDSLSDLDFTHDLYYVVPNIEEGDYFTDEPDLEMEKKMEAFFRRNIKEKKGFTSKSTQLYINLVRVEYRTSIFKSIKIASSTELFRQETGSTLNEYITVDGVSNDCVFDQSKQLIDMTNKNWSLAQYLSQPLYASPSLRLRFTSSPPEAPLETRFIIELELADGKLLRDTTDLVKLLP